MPDTNYISAAPACACGSPITKRFKSGKPGKFCTPCMEQNANKHLIGPRHIECAHCAKPFVALVARQKYCHPNCKYTARDRALGIKPMQYVKVAECKGCAKSFKPSMTRYSTYCSRECAFEHKAAAPSAPPAPASRVWAGHCKTCAAAFVSRRWKRYCGTDCRPKPAPPMVRVIPDRPCKCCHTTYTPVATGAKRSPYCSAECMDAVKATAKRIVRARRRAIMANATTERVDPYVVFRRDKWRCQLCKGKAPEAKRGTYDDDAPELDHIITLSEGGEHSYRNTQCACRKCNGEKSGRSMGQLLLLG